MPMTAQSALQRVIDTLLDAGHTRWVIPELVRYLNDGQREIVVYRPDATSTTASVALVAGARQALPANGIKLMEVVRNTSGAHKPVRMTDRKMLDVISPGWTALAGVTEIVHAMYDPLEPRAFYVYPPAAASGASLEITYSASPVDVATPAAGNTAVLADVQGNVSVQDIYVNPLVDYTLYRAFAKDAEFAGQSARASAHFGAFAQSLGIELKGTVGVAPNKNRAQVAA